MKMSKSYPIKEIVAAAGPLVTGSLGDLEKTVDHFANIKTATPTSLGFVNSPRSLVQAEDSPMACLLAPDKLKGKVEELGSQKTWLFSPNVELAACEVKKALVFPTPYRAEIQGIHETAIVDETAQLGIGVTVGPYAIIGKNVKLGEGTFIGAHTVIEENSDIKSHVTIHPLVYIGHSTVVGHACEIMPQATIASEGYGYAHDHHGNHYRIPHTGRVVLADDVHIGAGTAIDRGTIEDTYVGQGTKIDNQVHLAHNTVVGKNGLITAQTVTAGSSTIGDNFMCGGKTAITGHINVTDNVRVAGFSAITKDVTKGGQYGGHPLLPLQESLRVKASTTHLPELRKQMSRVLKKLFPEDFNS